MTDLAIPAQAHEETHLMPEMTDEFIKELLELVNANKVEGEHSWTLVKKNTPAAKLPSNIENVVTILLKSSLLKSFFTIREQELLAEIKGCMKEPNTSSGYDLNEQITQLISRTEGIKAIEFKTKCLAFVQYYKEHVASKLATELENKNNHDVVTNIIASFLSIIGTYAENEIILS